MARPPIPVPLTRQLFIHEDPIADIVTICGVRYSGQLFRQLALAEPGTWLRIEERGGNGLRVFQPDPTTERIFDSITGKSAGAQV